MDDEGGEKGGRFGELELVSPTQVQRVRYDLWRVIGLCTILEPLPFPKRQKNVENDGLGENPIQAFL